MRKLLIPILLILLSLSCQTIHLNTKEYTSDEITTIPFPNWEDRDALKSGLIAAEKHRIDDMPLATIYHLDLRFGSNPAQITGHETVRYFNQENVDLNEIYFHLMPNYLGERISVSNIQVNGEPPVYELEMNDTVMRISLPTPLKQGENIIIEMDFATTVPTELEKNYGILAYTNDVLSLAQAYPAISVYDDEGWNTAIPSEQGDVSYLDASFYLVRVNTPKDFVVVASGNEIKHEVTGGRQVTLYAAAPARDFYLAASPDYVHIQKDFGDYVVNSYAPKNVADGSEMALDVAAAALALFSEKYGPYPYTEFDIVSTPTYALGIEYPGMTAINTDLYDLDAALYGTTASVYLESTVVHEVGHQWFYNLVGNDQLDEPWLDESLAQYITWQYYLETYGESGGRGFEEALNQRWERADKEKVPLGMPVGNYYGSEYGGIIYGRGAFFFEALAKEMGTEIFDAFMKDYTQSQVWGIATTESMREIAERHCNCDLEALFEEWVY